jgi:hypothetical protein
MKMRYAWMVWSWFALVLIPTLPARSDEPAKDEFFEKQVRPLLIERCLECHGDKKPKAGLRLTSRANLLKGGDSGPAAVEGQPEESLIIQAIRYDDEPKMPPKGKLKDQEIAVLTRWVAMGLPWPETKAIVLAPSSAASKSSRFSDEQRRFWSFQPLQNVVPPETRDTNWPQTPLDRFILAALEANGLTPAAPADKRSLIRRATFDLTGLPPAPEEVEAFLADPAPDAFARVVDRLLASPQYGERWGRHWLDLVRYADSRDARGIGGLDDIGEAWRYRDWVVHAFNRDLPYDQFLIDQLAGDIVPASQPGAVNVEGLVATGLLTIGEWGTGDADKEKMMTDIVDDQIDVVGRAFLGLTLTCARCHDHKFDPIPTEDYYGLAGIFFSTHILPDPGAKTAGSPMLRTPLVPKAQVEAFQRHKAQADALAAHLKAIAGNGDESALPAETRGALADLRAALAAWRALGPPPIPVALAAQEGGVPKSAHEGIHDARIHIRGSYLRLGPVVPRHFPRILAGDKQPPIGQGSGRLELARWIARPDHPLTARVMVNRIWQYHFGEGIVRTPSNFGTLGERPTHPELLDWLARQFVASGWSIKAMHRLIMLSSAYQQSSHPSAEALRLDPDNRLFSRMNRRRLESEAVRDSLLAVAGRLDRTMGGPSYRDLAQPRRTLYLMTIRSDRSSFGPLFDAADAAAIVDRRTVSTVAPQALFLLNNPFALDQARALAQRILKVDLSDDRARIDYAYHLLYGRPATAEEIAIGLEALRDGADQPTERKAESSWEIYCQLLLCANEMIYID